MILRNLDEEWDEILILDLLTDAERHTDQISQTLIALLNKNRIEHHLVNCNSKQDVLNALQDAAQRAGSKSFMIHITAHGSKDAIGNNGTIGGNPGWGVPWAELRKPLQDINLIFKGNLVVNLLACVGIAGFSIDDLLDPEAAFYALIGPTRKLNGQEMRDVTTCFYTELINDSMIPNVIKKVIEHFDPKSPIIWGKSTPLARYENPNPSGKPANYGLG